MRAVWKEHFPQLILQLDVLRLKLHHASAKEHHGKKKTLLFVPEVNSPDVDVKIALGGGFVKAVLVWTLKPDRLQMHVLDMLRHAPPLGRTEGAHGAGEQFLAMDVLDVSGEEHVPVRGVVALVALVAPDRTVALLVTHHLPQLVCGKHAVVVGARQFRVFVDLEQKKKIGVISHRYIVANKLPASYVHADRRACSSCSCTPCRKRSDRKGLVPTNPGMARAFGSY